MTVRPARTCPRCGGVETVQVLGVEKDGRVQLRCSCGDRWDLSPVSPVAVPELRELGAKLVAGRRRAEIGSSLGEGRVVQVLAGNCEAWSVRVFELLDRERVAS